MELLGDFMVPTIYAALLLLVIVWALALLQRRVRVLQSQLDSVREDLRIVNDTIKMLSHGLKDPGHPLALGRPTVAPPET